MSEEKDSDAANLVTVDRRDLYDFVRGAIKDALSTEDEAMHDEGWLWAEASYMTNAALGKLSLQESEAGAVGYVHPKAREWLNEGSLVHIYPEKIVSNDCPVFLTPPSAQAIETAAIMRAEEVCDNYMEYALSIKNGVELVDSIRLRLRDLIPQDGRTELEEFGVDLLRRTLKQLDSCVTYPSSVNELRAIVNQAMKEGK